MLNESKRLTTGMVTVLMCAFSPAPMAAASESGLRQSQPMMLVAAAADSASNDAELQRLLSVEGFDADAAIAALDASERPDRSKIAGRAMIEHARTLPPDQLDTALEQVRVVIGLQ